MLSSASLSRLFNLGLLFISNFDINPIYPFAVIAEASPPFSSSLSSSFAPGHQPFHQASSQLSNSFEKMSDTTSNTHSSSESVSVPVRVLKATPEDAPAMIEVMDNAFSPTYHYQQMYPSGVAPKADKKKRIELMRQAMATDAHVRFFKAVLTDRDNVEISKGEEAAPVKGINMNENENDSNLERKNENIMSKPDRIVGWAQWKMYYDGQSEEDLNKESGKKIDASIEGMNMEHANYFWSTMDDNRKRLFGRMPYCSKSIKNLCFQF